MKKINKYLWLFIASVLVGAVFSACKDDEDLTKADALFRPIINTDDDDLTVKRFIVLEP